MVEEVEHYSVGGRDRHFPSDSCVLSHHGVLGVDGRCCLGVQGEGG